MHAFVAMPYGTKEGIDFNQIYTTYIRPALINAGFEVFRADEELRAGNIRTDMFQELLLADLVVVDLSIDNPNVWYELGVRHALRNRGVIQIQCKRDYLPFDVYVDRALRYHIKDGLPDPNHLTQDKQDLTTFALETIKSWQGRRISPVYHLLRYLKEPDWKTLRVDEANEFWEKYDEWKNRIEIVRMRGRPGDILVLADEVPTRVLRLEACRAAGNALLKLGQFAFALRMFDKALQTDPTDLESRRQKGIVLGRLKKLEATKVWVNELIKDHPDDAESWALLGRIEKDAWIAAWRTKEKTADQMREDARNEEGLLREAFEAYVTGFQRNPSHYYSGINALTLGYLFRHLTGIDEKNSDLEAIEGGVRWSIQCTLNVRPKDYWARVTLADLEMLAGNKTRIEQAYKAALAVAEKNWFAIDSPRQQLLLLKDLGFRPEEVDAAIKIFDRELAKLKAPEDRWTPRQVLLFRGHRIDEPGRAEPRFPADKEEIAMAAITKKLEELQACPGDLAISGGAAGGDLLFAETCLARGLRVEVCIPFDEPAFLAASTTFGIDKWRDRFYKVKENELTRLLIMPEELGPSPESMNSYARNNLWLLYTALGWGLEKLQFMCLWNRKEGDGPGGTKHMYDTVLKHAGKVHVLDTNLLW